MGPTSFVDIARKDVAIKELTSALVAMTALARDYAIEADPLYGIQIAHAAQIIEEYGFAGPCSPT